MQLKQNDPADGFMRIRLTKQTPENGCVSTSRRMDVDPADQADTRN